MDNKDIQQYIKFCLSSLEIYMSLPLVSVKTDIPTTSISICNFALRLVGQCHEVQRQRWS